MPSVEKTSREPSLTDAPPLLPTFFFRRPACTRASNDLHLKSLRRRRRRRRCVLVRLDVLDRLEHGVRDVVGIQLGRHRGGGDVAQDEVRFRRERRDDVAVVVDVDRPVASLLRSLRDPHGVLPALDDRLVRGPSVGARGSRGTDEASEDHQGGVVQHEERLKEISEPRGEQSQYRLHGARDRNARGRPQRRPQRRQREPGRRPQRRTQRREGEAGELPKTASDISRTLFLAGRIDAGGGRGAELGYHGGEGSGGGREKEGVRPRGKVVVDRGEGGGRRSAEVARRKGPRGRSRGEQ
mmetsp:Transcript_41638/g.76972  ORF Transcript_41638/g.76972 Transcript_41638/m.76972 type:complete len:297 (-) Transcript_41638:301-1191(-)